MILEFSLPQPYSELIGTLMENLIYDFGDKWSSLTSRNLSVLISLILKAFNVWDKNVDIILEACNLMRTRTSKFWLSKYLASENNGMHVDGRDFQRNDHFYDRYIIWSTLSYTKYRDKTKTESGHSFLL